MNNIQEEHSEKLMTDELQWIQQIHGLFHQTTLPVVDDYFLSVLVNCQVSVVGL